MQYINAKLRVKNIAFCTNICYTYVCTYVVVDNNESESGVIYK